MLLERAVVWLIGQPPADILGCAQTYTLHRWRVIVVVVIAVIAN